MIDQLEMLSIILFFAFLNIMNQVKCQNINCTHPIYCGGVLLHDVQMFKVFKDDKTFVDMPLKRPPEDILLDYEKIRENITKERLTAFVEENFDDVGSEIVKYSPPDFKESPEFLNTIKDPKLRQFGSDINAIWKILGRKLNHTKPEDHYSTLSVKHPMVVPGSRFSAFYYWDSLFILKGLLISGMEETSKGIILNMLDIVEEYGFVPNGIRVYFLSRSQPPLLIQMFEEYLNYTNDVSILTEENLQILEKEYEWWMTNRVVTLEGTEQLNRYDANWNKPRPESYSADYETTQDPEVWNNLAAGAETGWDFSSRWFKDKNDLSTIQTKNIIPVDLNSFMYANEKILSSLYGSIGHSEKQKIYQAKAILRKELIDKYLWNEAKGMWYDYNFKTQTQNIEYYVSNYVPLYYDLGEDKNVNIDTNVLNYIGGIPISLFFNENSPEQWDFPNAWAPCTYFMIEGLAKLKDYADIAYVQAQRYIDNAYCSFKKTNRMIEKYDVTTLAKLANGGEYEVQFGFGWSNGVALYYLTKYGSFMRANSCFDYTIFIISIVTISVVFFVIFVVFLLVIDVLGTKKARENLRKTKSVPLIDPQMGDSLIE